MEDILTTPGCSFSFFCGVFLWSVINISLGEQNTAGILELIQKQKHMTKTHTAASQLPGPASWETAVLYQHRDVVAVPRAHFNSLAWYYPLANLPLFVLPQVNIFLILLPFSMYKTRHKITCFVLRNTGRIKSLLCVQLTNWKFNQILPHQS